MPDTKKPHCKAPDHLQVEVTDTFRLAVITATFAAAMQCENHVQSWGVILSHHGDDLDRGLHLLPDAVAWLPNELRAKARDAIAAGNAAVTIFHTFEKKFRAFATIESEHAFDVATAIEKAAA